MRAPGVRAEEGSCPRRRQAWCVIAAGELKLDAGTAPLSSDLGALNTSSGWPGVNPDVVAPAVGEPPRAQRSSLGPDHGLAAVSSPHPGRCKRSATRSPSWSSTSRRQLTRPDPKLALGGRAPSQAIGVHALDHPSGAAGAPPARAVRGGEGPLVRSGAAPRGRAPGAGRGGDPPGADAGAVTR